MRTAVFLLAVVVLAVVQSAQAQVPKPELCKCTSIDKPVCVSVNFFMETFANRCMLDCAISQWKSGVGSKLSSYMSGKPYQLSFLHEGKCGTEPLPLGEDIEI